MIISGLIVGVKQGCIMSPLAVQYVYGCSDEGNENGDGRIGESRDYLASYI